MNIELQNINILPVFNIMDMRNYLQTITSNQLLILELLNGKMCLFNNGKIMNVRLEFYVRAANHNILCTLNRIRMAALTWTRQNFNELVKQRTGSLRTKRNFSFIEIWFWLYLLKICYHRSEWKFLVLHFNFSFSSFFILF